MPLDFYERFRDPLRHYQAQLDSGSNVSGNEPDSFDADVAVKAYQKLITQLPPLNRQLLLYILDLLAVFASKSDFNRMTAANLAAIFQPGIISHPTHDMAPAEYRLSQDVLIFLIENQDNFLIGMKDTAVDEKTVKDVESGAPSIKSPKPNLGRSASNASAGADSLRKFGVRRNVSVSSHASRERNSPGVSIPGTPSTPTQFAAGAPSSGLARSNTVPSKRSPAIAPARFQRLGDSSTPVSPAQMSPANTTNAPSPKPKIPEQVIAEVPVQEAQKENVQPASFQASPISAPSDRLDRGPPSVEPVPASPMPVQTGTTVQSATRERKISSLFAKSPIFGPSDGPSGQHRPTRKLQKRSRTPGSRNESAQSSRNSLHDEDVTFHTPMLSPDLTTQGRPDPFASINTAGTSTVATPNDTHSQNSQYTMPSGGHEREGLNAGLRPPRSPAASTHSRSSMTDPSDFDALDDKPESSGRPRNRFRFSSSARRPEDSPLAAPPLIGQHASARMSNSSIGSSTRPRKSFTAESQLTQPDTSSGGQPSIVAQSSQDSGELLRDASTNGETEKKGRFGKWMARMSQSREEKYAEKERAKSPPRSEHGASRNSLTASLQEVLAPRGRSFDVKREHETLPTVAEKPGTPVAHQATTISSNAATSNTVIAEKGRPNDEQSEQKSG